MASHRTVTATHGANDFHMTVDSCRTSLEWIAFGKSVNQQRTCHLLDGAADRVSSTVPKTRCLPVAQEVSPGETVSRGAEQTVGGSRVEEEGLCEDRGYLPRTTGEPPSCSRRRGVHGSYLRGDTRLCAGDREHRDTFITAVLRARAVGIVLAQSWMMNELTPRMDVRRSRTTDRGAWSIARVAAWELGRAALVVSAAMGLGFGCSSPQGDGRPDSCVATCAGVDAGGRDDASVDAGGAGEGEGSDGGDGRTDAGTTGTCSSTPPSMPPAPVTTQADPSMSTAQIQAALTAAAAGSTFTFAAGAYDITTPLNVPCASNVTITGPVATPPTAILGAAGSADSIFTMSNCTGVTIQHLELKNATGIYVGATDNSKITIQYDQFTNLQGDHQGVHLDGFLASTVTSGVIHNIDSDIVVENNTFGDAGSCTAEFASTDDLGGNCGGFETHTGELLRLGIQHNTFFHLEEPIHLIQDALFKVGATNGVCVDCVVDYNYLLNYHRIGAEIQVAIPNTGAGFEFSHNAVVDPLNPFYGTYAVSLACCEGAGFIIGDGQSAKPGQITNDDLLISTQGPGDPPYAFEWWGDQAMSDGSLVQGNFSNGFDYGYGDGPRAITNAYVCGPKYTTQGGYVVSEGYPAQYAVPPTQTNVTTSPTCMATPSTPPKVASSGGLVTLTDPAPNTSIFYTTDGSAPVPGSGTTKLYTGPLSGCAGTTINAVGMWGVAPLPSSYPRRLWLRSEQRRHRQAVKLASGVRRGAPAQRDWTGDVGRSPGTIPPMETLDET